MLLLDLFEVQVPTLGVLKNVLTVYCQRICLQFKNRFEYQYFKL